jgi:hypothetical protein
MRVNPTPPATASTDSSRRRGAGFGPLRARVGSGRGTGAAGIGASPTVRANPSARPGGRPRCFSRTRREATPASRRGAAPPPCQAARPRSAFRTAAAAVPLTR